MFGRGVARSRALSAQRSAAAAPSSRKVSTSRSSQTEASITCSDPLLLLLLLLLLLQGWVACRYRRVAVCGPVRNEVWPMPMTPASD